MHIHNLINFFGCGKMIFLYLGEKEKKFKKIPRKKK